MELINVSIKQFLSVDSSIDYEVYAYILKQVRPAETLLDITMPKLVEQPYKYILSIESLFKQIESRPYALIEIVAICLQVETEKLEPIGVFEFYPVFNSIQQQYIDLVTREKKFLSHDPEPEELEAGLENLGKFGRLMTVDALSGGDILRHNQIIELPYSRIFTKLYMDSEKAKIQKELYRIKSRKE